MSGGMRSLLVCLSLFALLVSSGCSWFIVGAGAFAIYSVTEDGDDESVSTNASPSAQVSDPGRVTATVAVISYTLFDTDGDACDVVVQYSTNGGSSFAAATAATGSEGVNGLSASEAGSVHTFTWDWAADLTGSLYENVVVSVRPTDSRGSAGVAAQSPVFILGNSAPSVAIDAIPDASRGIILVNFYLTDQTGDLVDITVEYATDGTTYHDATIVLGATTGISSSPTGAQHALAWDTEADGIAQDGSEQNVTIRITPTDQYGLSGTAFETAQFSLGNVKPVADIVYQNWGRYAAAVDVEVLLKDVESDDCDILVEYSHDDGKTWGVATLLNQTNPIIGQTSNPAGLSKTFTWDFKADDVDISTTAKDDVYLRITPSDAFNAIGTQTRLRLSVGYNFRDMARTLVETGSFQDHAPQVSYDTLENLHAVWESTITAPDVLRHRIWNADGSVNTTVTVPTVGSDATQPDIAKGTSGKIHLVYQEWATPGEIYYKFYDGSAWDAANVNLSNTASDNSISPCVVVDASEKIHVVWLEEQTPAKIFYATNASGTWSAAVDITPAAETSDCSDVSICIDDNDDIHVVYYSNTHVRYFARISGTWQTAATVLTTGVSGTIADPAIAVDSTGARTVAFSVSPKLMAVRYDGSWGAPVEVCSFSFGCGAPKLALGRDDTIHCSVVGASGFMNSIPCYLICRQGIWSSPRDLTYRAGRAEEVAVAVSDLGMAGVAWEYTKDWISAGDMSTYGGIGANQTDPRWIGQWEIFSVETGGSVGQGALASGPLPFLHAAVPEIGSSAKLIYRKFIGIWDTEETISATSQTPETPTLEVTSDESVHAIWVESVSAVKRVMYSARDSASWSTTAAISSDQGDASAPEVVVDGLDNLHAVWARVTGTETLIYYATRPSATGTWSSPAVVSQASGVCGDPAIVVDDGDGLHVVYSRHTGAVSASEIYYTEHDGSWSTPALLSGSDTEAIQPGIYASGSAASLLVHAVYSADGTTDDQAIRINTFSGGSWGGPGTVREAGDPSFRNLRPEVVTDGNGQCYVVFIEKNAGDATGFIVESVQGTWVDRVDLSLADGAKAVARIEKDSGGHLHFLFSDGEERAYYTHRR